MPRDFVQGDKIPFPPFLGSLHSREECICYIAMALARSASGPGGLSINTGTANSLLYVIILHPTFASSFHTYPRPS